MLKQKYIVLFVVVVSVFIFCIDSALAWQSDNGEGTYTNPVLYADYPDPDIIRVGSYFYMVSTTFVDSPGLVVLRYQDMVNWDILSHAASYLDINSDYDMLNGATVYRKGMWASSIRYYNGTFYIVVNPWGAPGARVYYATDPAGSWNYYQLGRGAYDPVPDSNYIDGVFVPDGEMDPVQITSKGHIINCPGASGVFTRETAVYYRGSLKKTGKQQV